VEKVKSQGPHSELYLYNEGEVVVKEGHGSSIIYILMRGTLGVYKGENKVNEIKGNGVIFGEMSSILGKPRSVSIKAEEQCEIMVYRGGIHGIIRRFPSITQKILVILAERLEAQTTNYSGLQSKCEFIEKELISTREELKVLQTEKPQPTPGRFAAEVKTEKQKVSDKIDSNIYEALPTEIEYMAIPPKKRK